MFAVAAIVIARLLRWKLPASICSSIDRGFAIDALAREDSAEGHYLKAIALQSVGEHTPAREQIDESLAIAPEEVKYKGYQALLDLASHKQGAAQRLIDLYDLHSSSPAIAFFATRTLRGPA